MNIWHSIRKDRIRPDRFLAVIEISKGSKKKYELDKETGLLILDRLLYTATQYPANYGFIPRTYATDDDPLDVLVMCGEALDGLTTVECYPIGVMRMLDSEVPDDKIIAVPFNDPTWNFYKDIKDLPPHIMEEILHFFTVYKQLENKKTSNLETLNAAVAKKIIQKAINAYNEKY